jgi:hypothetical protein
MVMTPPIMNSTRLGDETQTATTKAASPSSIVAIPARSARRRDHLVVTSCATTVAEKTANRTAPRSACDPWCSGPARNTPTRPENSPKTTKTVSVLHERERDRPETEPVPAT